MHLVGADTHIWSKMTFLIPTMIPTHLRPSLLSSGRGLEYAQSHQIIISVRFPSFTYCFATPFLFTHQFPPLSSFPPSTLDACRRPRTGYVIGQATFVSHLDDGNGGQSMYHAWCARFIKVVRVVIWFNRFLIPWPFHVLLLQLSFSSLHCRCHIYLFTRAFTEYNPSASWFFCGVHQMTIALMLCSTTAAIYVYHIVSNIYDYQVCTIGGKGKSPWQACPERATSVPICTLRTQIARLGHACPRTFLENLTQ